MFVLTEFSKTQSLIMVRVIHAKLGIKMIPKSELLIVVHYSLLIAMILQKKIKQSRKPIIKLTFITLFD